LFQHLNENPGFHLYKMKQFFDDEIYFLKSAFEAQLHEKDEKIKQLEKIAADRTSM
jgi:hypothetical protein